MPYINRESRIRIALTPVAQTPGELNYMITDLCLTYLRNRDVNYTVLNEIIGAMECAKQEFYRRMMNPYEEMKCQTNGDVYV